MSKQWYIVTNTENLKHFFNYCLIFDKQGFSNNSYLIDAMDGVPKGYIPCFSKDGLAYALKKSIEEDSNLVSCILEINIKLLKDFNSVGSYLVNSELSNRKQSSVNELFQDEGVNCILLPAPLPFSFITKVFLPNSKVKDSTKKLYERQFKESKKRDFFKVNRSLFKVKEVDNIQPTINGISEDWKVEDKIINYNKVFAYGGSLGLVYYQTKNGLSSTRVFNHYKNTEIQGVPREETVELDYLTPFFDYFYGNNVDREDVNEIYKQLLDRLIPSKTHGESKFIISNFLKKVDSPQNYISKCDKLSISLDKLSENIVDKDPATIFKIILNDVYEDDISFRNFALLMTLFFLRGHTVTALKYYHSDFKEEHYILVALLFGAIYGIVNIPDEIRQVYDLSNWLSYKMVQFAHTKSEFSITFQKAPREPLLIYEDVIKTKATKVRRIHDLYDWINKRYNNDNVSLIETIQALPKSGEIKNQKIVSYGLPEIEASLDIERLGHYIREKIQEDELFDMNVIFDAYIKYTK